MENQNQELPIANNEEVNAEIEPVITKVKTGIKMNLNAKGFLNFMKTNNIYLDKTILIKDIIDNKAGNDVVLTFFFNSSKS